MWDSTGSNTNIRLLSVTTISIALSCFTLIREKIFGAGSGFNASLGAIYKVNLMLQFGGTIISPTFTAIKETFSQNVSAGYADNLVTGRMEN